jgi:hypothetical protein
LFFPSASSKDRTHVCDLLSFDAIIKSPVHELEEWKLQCRLISLSSPDTRNNRNESSFRFSVASTFAFAIERKGEILKAF